MGGDKDEEETESKMKAERGRVTFFGFFYCLFLSFFSDQIHAQRIDSESNPSPILEVRIVLNVK